MKRILVITRNYPPLWGGMERLNLHMVEELAKRFEVRLVAPMGATKHATPQVRVHEVPLKPLWRFLFNAGWQAWLQRAWKPDVVLAGSGLTAPLALLAARVCGARALAYTHGLDLAVPHRTYRALWFPALRRMDCVIANSQATAELARHIGIAPEKIVIIHPGVAMPDLDPQARQRFREQHGLGNRPVLLSVGRLTARKGLREFVQEVLPQVVADRADAVLVVVGDAPTDSLFAQAQTPESIMEAAQTLGLADNVRFLGKRFGTELADAYTGADVHVFPVRDLPNDPEGFGMVAVEAAAHGLPTVGTATGGVVDAVSEGRSGFLVKHGAPDMFASSILAMLNQPLRAESCRTHAQAFTWERFAKQMIQTVQRVTPGKAS